MEGIHGSIHLANGTPTSEVETGIPSRHAHTWLRHAHIAFAPGPTTPLLEQFITGLLECFREHGHTVYDLPQEPLDALLTSAAFGTPIGWRKATIAHARRKYGLTHTPAIFTLLHATPGEFQGMLERLAAGLAKDPPDPADFAFPGLQSNAYKTLVEQGRRGGAIMALERLVQSQAMCIRNILIVGDDRPREAYTFDLAGAHPRTPGDDLQAFYTDLMLRILTAVSTQEITQHEVRGEPFSRAAWKKLATPAQMREGGRQLGLRGFFTEMVEVANLVNMPYVPDTVAKQYSEGCFATWEPQLNALLTTVTGSARPVNKYKLSDDDLALITSVRADGLGAVVRYVQGLRNDPPSSEAVELMLMDEALPHISLKPENGYTITADVPVARSKLHGHRGVRSYNPQFVEHVALDEAYYHYPVSCATQAQALSTKTAFSRSQALQNPADLRMVVFTILPGHGVMITEKWAQGKAPFQLIWEAMDRGDLEIASEVPQGVVKFVEDGEGRRVLKEDLDADERGYHG